MIRICLAGITGKTGRELFLAIQTQTDMQLVSGVARSAAGTVLDDVPVFSSVTDALKDVGTDVLVDYTHPSVVKHHVLAAVESRVRCVVGTSGLTDEDYVEIASAVEQKQTGVIAVGNFAISANLLERFALEAAKHMPGWEIVDYGSAGKPDSPSGTARELAFHLRDLVTEASPTADQPARGQQLNGTQVHSLRLPGVYSGIEIQFGLPGERLILRHESTGVLPYVGGTLVAIRRVLDVEGLVRGL